MSNTITVTRSEEPSKIALECKTWLFEPRLDFYGPMRLVLERYSELVRPTPRHKWRGKHWVSGDERVPVSYLKRPTDIPADVVAEAMTRLVEFANRAEIQIGHGR